MNKRVSKKLRNAVVLEVYGDISKKEKKKVLRLRNIKSMIRGRKRNYHKTQHEPKLKIDRRQQRLLKIDY